MWALPGRAYRHPGVGLYRRVLDPLGSSRRGSSQASYPVLFERPLQRTASEMRSLRASPALLAALLSLASAACSSTPDSSTRLTIDPPSAAVAPGDHVQFTATVAGPADEPVVWSVVEQGGGTIDERGAYTAPQVEGTFHVAAWVSSPSTVQTVEVQVTRSVVVTVTPATATVPARGSVALSAAVTGSVKTVTWSVAEGASGGTVGAGGLYTAPAAAGSYHVVATSTADASKSGTATITVTAAAPPPGGTTPPSDGTTAWAPAAGDASWANVMNYGAVGDGVADDTGAFIAAAATRRKLFIPAPRSFYRLTRFVPVFDSVYGDGSMPFVRMFGATGFWDNSITYQGHGGHVMFLMDNYAGPGATFQGLHLDGGFAGQAGGEHDHLIMIRGSKNVTVQHNVLDNPFGDGVLVGGEANPIPSQNVTIRNNRMTNPKRCGVALISSRNVSITNNDISKLNDFVTAIDVEPNPIGTEDVWGAEIAYNNFYVPHQGAIMLYWAAGAKDPIGGDISVHHNTGSAVWAFWSNNPAKWSNVSVYANF